MSLLVFSYLLLLKYGCSAPADNRGPSPSPSPIWPGTGTLRVPRPRPRFVRNRGRSPVPVPDLPGTGTLPRPRFPSGGPRPGRFLCGGRRCKSAAARRPAGASPSDTKFVKLKPLNLKLNFEPDPGADRLRVGVPGRRPEDAARPLPARGNAS